MTSHSYFPATGMPDADWWSVLWPDPAGTLRKLGVTGGQAVVDLCCGDGLFTVPLCALIGKRGRIYALDLDPLMLAAAKHRMDRQGPAFAGETCTWIEADAERFDGLLGEPVDAVLMANTFHGVPDKPALANAVRRALTPGGRFIIINWQACPREETTVLGQPRGPETGMRMAPDDVRQILSPAGYDLENLIELPPWHYGAVFRVAKGC